MANLKKDYRFFLGSLVILVLVLMPVSQAIPPAFPLLSTTGVIVPTYLEPYNYTSTPATFGWAPILNAKHAHPGVAIASIVNVYNGPGPNAPPNCAQNYQQGVNRTRDYNNGIGNLTNAGVVVFGYVFSTWGHRDYHNAIADIDKWVSCYPKIKGILIDEMANNPTSANLTYYQNLTNYIHVNKGLAYSFGNPGTDTKHQFIGTVDNMDIFENSRLPSATDLKGQYDGNNWHLNYSKTNFSFVTFNVTSFPNQSTINNFTHYVSYMYINDNSGCYHKQLNCNPQQANPWNLTSIYLGNLTQALDNVSMTTRSVNLTGYQFNGQYTVIKNSTGGVLKTGYTPITINATNGTKYNVNVQNYQQYVFDHWDGGSISAYRDIVPLKNTTLTAYFKTPVTLTVKSVDLYGRTISGYHTVIRSSTGQILASGYTPFIFTTGSTGVTYTAKVDNFNNVNFTHWDTGSTSNPRTITPVRATTIFAYYNNSTALGQHSTYKINIQSKSLVGDPVTGLFVQIYNKGGSLNTTGYTPLSFTANNNKQYSVLATLAYKQWHWNHWDGGSTNNNRTFTALVGQNLTEYYTVPTNITVNTVDKGGNPLSTGLTFKIFNSTGLAKQGIPSFTYTGSSNYTYTIQAGNSSSYKFSHWDYTASTNLNRTLTPMSNTIITAYYKN